jgi:hypothetical protein
MPRKREKDKTCVFWGDALLRVLLAHVPLCVCVCVFVCVLLSLLLLFNTWLNGHLTAVANSADAHRYAHTHTQTP